MLATLGFEIGLDLFWILDFGFWIERPVGTRLWRIPARETFRCRVVRYCMDRIPGGDFAWKRLARLWLDCRAPENSAL